MIPGISDRNTVGANSDTALGDLGEDTFLQLMVAQMQYQNPMEPTDPTTMIQQTSLMTQVEALRDVLELQQQMIGFQEVTLASGMVGQDVVADTEDGTVTGTVTSVRFTSEGPLMTVGGRELSLSATREVVVGDGTVSTPRYTTEADQPADAESPAPDVPGADPAVPPSTATPDVGTDPSAQPPADEVPTTVADPMAVPEPATPATAEATTWASVAAATIGGRWSREPHVTGISADQRRAGARQAWT